MIHKILLTAFSAALIFSSSAVYAQSNDIQNLLPDESGAALDESLTVLQIPVDGDEAENLTIMQIPDVENVPAPSSEALSRPTAAVSAAQRDVRRLEQVQAAESGAVSQAARNVPDGVFYDSDNIPASEMTRNQGPIPVDPRSKVGSRFVVVRETHGAGSYDSVAASAQRAMDLGRYASALQIYDDLHRKNARDPQVIMGKAIALQRLGRSEEAVLAYNDFLALRPNDLNARVNMLGLMSQKYPSVALRQLLDLRQEHSSHIGVTAQLAVTYAQLNDIPSALKFLGIAAGMDPENPLHIYNMAVIADTSKNKKEAVKFYEEALEIDAVYASNSVLPRDKIYERLARIR